MKWTAQEEEILRRLAAKNLTLRKAQLVLKSRSIDSIRAKAESMGVVFPGWETPEIDLNAFSELTGEVIEG